jgi:ribosomal protein S18 acetylase RimI-like enzyme
MVTTEASNASTLLSPMSEPEFADYLEFAIPDFAADKVNAGQWSTDEALELARQGYDELLPQGLATPGHFLYTVRNQATGAAVGMVWFAAQARAGRQIAFIYDVYIVPEHQRQGHAKRALAAMEDAALSQGLSGIALHVFGHNAAAQALYRQLGFEATNINMFKAVGTEVAQ